MDLAALQSYLDQRLSALGFELLCLETAGSGNNAILRLYIDHVYRVNENTELVTIDDCILVNDNLVEWLEVDFPEVREQFALEVSSPGLDRPLVKPQHFLRFLGKECRIQANVAINGQRNFKGRINAVADESVVIIEDGIIKTIPFTAMKKARLII